MFQRIAQRILARLLKENRMADGIKIPDAPGGTDRTEWIRWGVLVLALIGSSILNSCVSVPKAAESAATAAVAAVAAK